MAYCYSIACRDCKERLWIGQAGKIYTGMPEVMKNLSDFITERHHEHDVIVRSDLNDELLGYEEYVPDKDE